MKDISNEYSKINNKRWKDYAASVDRYAKHLYPRKISTIQKADIQELFNNLTKLVSMELIDFLRY
ncbi:integrase domain protein [Rickettsia amblyommatis str. Darkwater]|nr:integrase domain protein [Rickettsia amblyommatis str. Darkwater]